MTAHADKERRELACGCRIDLAGGRLLGFNRTCTTANALSAQIRNTLNDAAADAAHVRLVRHAMLSD